MSETAAAWASEDIIAWIFQGISHRIFVWKVLVWNPWEIYGEMYGANV